MIARAAAAAINHVLHQEGWPLERLRPYAGRSLLFRVPPFDVALMVSAAGDLAAAPPDAAPDATFRLSPPLLLRIAAGDEAARQEVGVEGDSGLAQAVLALARNLRWDAEDDLARVFGDVAGRRLAQGGRDFLQWQARAALDLGKAVSEYLTEEQPLIARSPDVSEFVAEVDRLRDDVERLEKRLAKLSRPNP
ncbi:MAG TPA: SCP2 sterol-binding domain-containing protein [Burkholderiales bacterium]|nr:SCP2 sterol-binding domain-containing protein [Burkholderiales bacterium]